MRGLEAVTLIGAGRFSDARLKVERHVQVFGENGNGKSTLCRALLFFYLGEPGRSNYGLDPSKHDWPDYYLSVSRSYVIYEVARGEGLPFHIAVTRPGRQIQFLFVDAPFRREYYAEEAGLHAARIKPFDEVISALDAEATHYEKVDSYAGFQERIYGIKTSPFNVFLPVHGKQDKALILGQAIAGMFRASAGGIDKMDLGKFRNVLVSTVSNPQEAQIDIQKIANNISNFTNDYGALTAYQKQEQNADFMLATLGDIENAQRECDGVIREFASRFKCVQPAKREREESLARYMGEEEKNKGALAELERVHSSAVEGMNMAIGQAKEKIQTGERTKADYESKDIRRKRQELDELPVITLKLGSVVEQLSLLKRKYTSEDEWRKEALGIVETDWNRHVGLHNKKTGELVRSFDVETHERREHRDTAIESVRQAHEEKLDGCKASRKPLEGIVASANTAIKESYALAETPELKKGKQQRSQTERDKGVAIRKSAEIDSRRKNLATQDELEQTKAQQEFERESARIAKDLNSADIFYADLSSKHDVLLNNRKATEGQLKAFDASLASFYREHAPEGWRSASKVLDQDILFRSAESLSAECVTGGHDDVFGVSLKLDSVSDRRATFDRAGIEANLEEINISLEASEAEKTKASGEQVRLKQEATTLENTTKSRKENLKSAQESRREAADREISECDDQIQLLNQKIEFLDHQIEVAQQEFDNKQEQLRSLCQSRIADSEKKISEIREAEESSRASLKEAEAKIKLRFSDAQEESLVRRKGLEAEIEKDFQDKEKACIAERAKIEKEFQSRIAGMGADTGRIDELTCQESLLTEQKESRENCLSEVIQMETLWKAHVVPLDAHRDELKSAESKKSVAESEHSGKKATLVNEGREIASAMSSVNRTLGLLTDDEKAAQDFALGYPQHAGRLDLPDVEAAQPFNAGTLAELLRDIKRLKNDEDGWNADGAEKFRKFRGGFAPEEIKFFGWTSSIEFPDWKIFAGLELRSIRKNNTISHRNGLLSDFFGVLVASIDSQLTRFEEAMTQVHTTARHLGDYLAEEKLMDLIDFIRVRVEPVDGRLHKKLQKISELRNLHFGSGTRDLFSAPASRDHVEKAIKAFADLSGEIERTKKDKLLLEECFNLEVMVSENGRPTGWEPSIGAVGSHGTAYLVKMSIYLALLEIIRSGTFRNKSEVRVHCLFDEAGTISPKHIDAILKYAERKGITLIAAGQAQSSGAFSSWFQVWKNEQSTETEFFGQLKASKIKDVKWQ